MTAVPSPESHPNGLAGLFRAAVVLGVQRRADPGYTPWPTAKRRGTKTRAENHQAQSIWHRSGTKQLFEGIFVERSLLSY
jgi:hypothetical protein